MEIKHEDNLVSQSQKCKEKHNEKMENLHNFCDSLENTLDKSIKYQDDNFEAIVLKRVSRKCIKWLIKKVATILIKFRH